jgi:hypothetical protein
MLLLPLVHASSAAANDHDHGASGLHAKESAKPETEPVIPVDDEGQVAGYNKGHRNPIFVQSKDGLFRLDIGAYTQLRYNGVTRETPPAGDPRFDSGWVFARTRFLFQGRAGENINYELRLQISSEGEFNLLTAYVGYNFGDYGHNSRTNRGAWSLMIGQQFLAHMVDMWQYPEDKLTTEYSGVNYAFAIGVNDSVQAFFGKDRYRLWMAVSNGRFNPPIVAGSNGEIFGGDIRTGMVMFSGRGEVQLIGNDWTLYKDDLSRRTVDGRNPGLRLGVAGAYSLGVRDQQPQPDLAPPKNALQLTMDITAGGNGFQVLAQGVWNWFDDPTPTSRWGFMVRGGYFILEPWNVYAQYALVDPGTQTGYGQFNAVTLGTSWYPFPWSNRYRFSAEGGLLFNPISASLVSPNPTIGWLEDDQGNQYYCRLEVQFGF